MRTPCSPMSISDTLMWRYYDLLSFRSDGRDRPAARRGRGRPQSEGRQGRWLGDHGALPQRGGAEAAEGSRLRQPPRSAAASRHEIPEVSVPAARWASARCSSSQPGAASSEGDAPLIDGGGVRIDGAVVSDKGLKVERGTYVVQVGKRKFAARSSSTLGPLTIVQAKTLLNRSSVAAAVAHHRDEDRCVVDHRLGRSCCPTRWSPSSTSPRRCSPC